MKWERLIEGRKNIGQSQTGMAALLGVSKSTYVRWENGVFQPNFEQLLLISRYLYLPIDYLLYNDLFDFGDAEYWHSLRDLTQQYRDFQINEGGKLPPGVKKDQFLNDLASKYNFRDSFSSGEIEMALKRSEEDSKGPFNPWKNKK